MKNFTTEIYNEKAKSGARYYIRATIDGVPIQDELQNFDYNANCNPDRVFSIGNVGSAMVEFEIYQPSQNLTNKEILIEQGIKLNGVIEYVKLGYFNVLKPTNNRGVYKYQCVDRMISKMEMPYFSELTFPTTDIAMLKEICTQVGISLDNENSLISHAITNNLQGYTKREIIAYLSQLQGKNAIINSEGNLELIWYTPTNYVVDDDKIYMDRADEINSETDYVIEYIKCNVTTSEGIIEIQSGDGLNGITISNPFMTQAILDEVFANIGGFSFRPVEFDFYGDFRLEVGDVITLSTYGQTYNVPIMQLTQKSDGGVITSITSIAETETENNINLKSPNTKEMDRYYADLIIINQAMVSKLDADSAIIKDLTAKTTKTDTLIFGSAGGNVIQTSFSNSVIAQLGDAQIKSAMIQDVSASKISAGTIYTNDVTIQSKNGQMMLKDNTIQISDGTRARVQIGKDASNDYSINVWDKSGNLMFSQGGITDAAIKDAIIRNDMVSENANIHAGKLDISSLFTEINNSSEIIKANKIYLDEQKQTLEVSFKTMTTTVDGLKQTQTSQGTQITAIQGLINSKVWQQDITTAIDDINIGGRNLLLNSSEKRNTIINNAGTQQATDIYMYSEYGKKILHDGSVAQITVSLDYSTELTQGTLAVQSGYNKWYSFGHVSLADGQSGHLECTFDIPAGWLGSTNIGLRVIVDSFGEQTETVVVSNFKCEIGNKATSYTVAPEDTDSEIVTLTTKYSTLEQDISGFKTTVSETYSTKTETKTVETIATQTANKFNWIVKNGTSATNFTLTDRMAKLTAEIISLNGNVKVNGDMLVAGAVTADKIDVTDLFTQNITVNGTFKANGSAWLSPAKEDLDLLRKSINGEITLTAAQKTAFDFDVNGKVDLFDFAICKASILRDLDILNNYPSYNPVNSNVNVTINPKNPKKIIDITATNSFGRNIDVFFGMDGINVPSVDTGLINCYTVQSQDDVIANYGTDNEIKLSELYGLNNMLKILANKTVTAASDGTITLTFDSSYAKKISRMGVMFVQINDNSNSYYGYVAVPYMNNASSWGVSGDNIFNLYGGNGGISSVKVTRSSTALTQTTIKIIPNVSATYASKTVNVRVFCLSLGME